MWTIDQQKAIDLEGTNIIVSAGAGSGKTAVLSERVLRKVKSGIHINELLILTFTKAAAFEMKERIRKKLKEANLKEEANLIDSAFITTFDAFSLALVKKYHTKLNVTHNISITDEVLINFEKKRILAEIMEENYLTCSKNFTNLIKDFCLKDDEKLQEYLLNIYKKLELKYDKEAFLNTYIKKYYSTENIDNLLNEYNTMLLEKITEMKNILQKMSLYLDGSYIEEVETSLKGLFEAKTYQDIRNNLNIKIKMLPRNCDLEVKTLKSTLTDIYSEIKDLASYENETEIKEELLATIENATTIISLLQQLDKRLTKFKKENNFYTFNDISKMAIDVVVENKDVLAELKNTFKEILVDEYQDTSDIQEKFISLISNNNVYMVGDIKQSIYRFRNANPYIFKNKYDTYSDNKNGIKIDLLQNFRSRDEVLQNINMIFDLIMDDTIGGANYKKAHKMIFGNKSYSEEGLTKQDYNIELLTYDKNIKSANRDELEAFIIADDINRKIASNFQIFDKDTKTVRPCTYQDFVILIDKGTSFDLYKKIFEYNKIPLNILREEKIGKDKDILVIKNLLRFLICLKEKNFDLTFKYTFISLARSFLFRLSDEEIYEIYINDTYKDTTLYKKCLELSLKIDELSPSEYLYFLLDQLNYDEALVTLGNISSFRVREEYIYKLITDYEKMGKTIYEFADYLDELFKNGIDLKFENKEKIDDSVRIMTIHKSKGLEFPICYFAGFSNEFNLSELRERITFDNKYGLVLPKVNGYYKDTIAKTLLKQTTRKEEISEKIRLLYVAMTRAKEKMIIVTKELEAKETDDVSFYEKYKYNNFYTILKSIYSSIEPFLKESKVIVNPLYKENNKQLDINISKTAPLIIDENYPEFLEITTSRFSKEHHLVTASEKKAMAFGEEVHQILEQIDFTKPDFSKFNVSDEVIENINYFLNTPLIKENIQEKMYKEYEFIYEDETLSHGIIDLLIEKEQEMLIIDYKLKNIDDILYDKQLNGYRKFIKNKTKKSVKCYLYSIIDKKFREVEDEDLLCMSR